MKKVRYNTILQGIKKINRNHNNDIRDIMFMICNKFKFNLENITNNDVDNMIDTYYNNRD